jgi:signal transduction histidine kinase
MPNPIKSGNEVKAVSRRVHSLIEDVDRTKTELERSQKYLLQAEKLAVAGKLAAGVAHSVRNPLTSVKMRLFSLGRTLDLSQTQKEDFDVISEEIRHIDTIVQNFLEFSRPPKLKMEKASPSDVVDTALQLLRYRLESYGAHVKLNRQRRLPEILADPEQLKEVLVNLLVNACEAMGAGGRIVISEQAGVVKPLGQVVAIRVSDNGPGVPETIQDKLFEPFFTTKEEGTGLGLSIAARIVKEHGGWLNLTSEEGEGATFIITLPCAEERH